MIDITIVSPTLWLDLAVLVILLVTEFSFSYSCTRCHSKKCANIPINTKIKIPNKIL
jgi:hypothetical protein